MSSTVEQSHCKRNSTHVEHWHTQDHHPTVVSASIDQITPGPTMQQHIERPLSTYTSLGSPIHRSTTGLFVAPRKMSIGDGIPSSPLLSTIKNRSRSNSQSAVFSGIPSLLLPLQKSIYDDVVYVHPTVDGNVSSPEMNIVAPKAVAMPHNLSDGHKKVIEATRASEKKLAIELEKGEECMSSEELRLVLKRERARTAKIQADLKLVLLKYNDLLSQHQQHVNPRMGEPSEADRVQQGLLTRRKRKLEAVESTNR